MSAATERAAAPELAVSIAAALLETDALTPNHDGTPEHYVVEAENVEYLVQTVLDLAADCPPPDLTAEQLIEAQIAAANQSQRRADGRLHAAAAAARAAGWSYARIGKVLGVTRQAAWERFS